MSQFVEQYADLPLGTTDASVVAIAERMGIEEIATLDRRHFTVVRPRHLNAFVLLPEQALSTVYRPGYDGADAYAVGMATARPVPASQRPMYRLRLRHSSDFTRRLEALGSADYQPPGHRSAGLVAVEYELHAQPPARWRLRRVRDVGGEPPERDERLILEDRWFWFQSEDAVEYDESREGAPRTFWHLFTPESLLSLCQVEPERRAVLGGRSVRTMTMHPRPGHPPQVFGYWGGGADTYRLHIDEETGIALRAEAFFAGHVFLVDEVTSLEVDPTASPDIFEPHLDPHDVFYRKGEVGPGIRVAPARAARYADRDGFDLLLPQSLPPGASLRVWNRRLTEDRPGGIRVQVDLASGRNLVFMQHAVHEAAQSATVRGRTAFEVSGTATAAEAEGLLSLLVPVQ